MGAVAVVQAAIASANLRWYGGLLRPSFSPAPSSAAVGIAAVACTLAAGFYRVLRRPDYLPDRPTAIRLVLIGLALDLLWSWLFFAGRHPTVALAAAGALAVFAALSTHRFALVDRRAGLLSLPWVAAAGFAFLLDLSIALRNG